MIEFIEPYIGIALKLITGMIGILGVFAHNGQGADGTSHAA